MHGQNPRQQGFTLIELIVTIAILIVLAGVLVPSVSNYLEKSNRGKASAEMKEVANLFAKYKADTFRWPTPKDKLPITTGNHAFSTYYGLYRNTTRKAGWDGPYLNRGIVVNGKMRVSAKRDGAYKGFVDPWERQYRVFTYSKGYQGSSGGIMLVSYGYDGKLSSSPSAIFADDAQGDDMIQLITYSLK